MQKGEKTSTGFTGNTKTGSKKKKEKWLLLGANGAIYAIRKSLYWPIPSHTIVDDFLIGMRVHQSGYQFLYDKTALAREETAPTIRDEFQRRTRIGAGNFQSLGWLSELLWPGHGLVSWAFWSHKVLRWICPILMIVALVTNFVLANQPIYRELLISQSVFYGLALLGRLWKIPGKLGSPTRLAWMFVMMNVALGFGFHRWLFKTQKGT